MHGFDRNEAGKLFVGGLSWDTTKDSLLEYFSQYGEVVDCIVMKNPETGKSRGFGFVTYRDTSCVDLVLSSQAHIVDGRQVDPKACNPKGQQRGGGPMGEGGPKMNRGPRHGGPNADKKIFLGGLPNSADEGAIRNFFTQYGKVLEVTVMYDNQKNRSRGFGFLTFETEDAVNAVCREHYINFNGKKIECKRATPRTQGPGGSDDHPPPMPGPHPGMPPLEMMMPPPHQQQQQQQGPPGPEGQWPPQEAQWNPHLQQQPPQAPGGPGQFQQLPPGQFPHDQAAAVPPGWPQQQPNQPPAGWPPGSVPPPQQPGALPGQPPFMAQQPPVSSPYSVGQAFQPPPGAPVYQYTAAPPGAPQPPPANGQVPPNPAGVGQPGANSMAYTAPSYAAPGAPQAPQARPGYQEFTGSHVQVATSLAPVPGTPTAVSSAAYSYPSPYGTPTAPTAGVPQAVPDPYGQTVAPPGLQVGGAPPPMGAHPVAPQPPGIAAAAYGSTPLPQGQIVAGTTDPNAPKTVDYASYYSSYGYQVDGNPAAGAAAGGVSAAYGGQPAPAPTQVQAPGPAQPPYGSPEPTVQYSSAPGPSPTYQRQGSGQSYHPYARR